MLEVKATSGSRASGGNRGPSDGAPKDGADDIVQLYEHVVTSEVVLVHLPLAIALGQRLARADLSAAYFIPRSPWSPSLNTWRRQPPRPRRFFSTSEPSHLLPWLWSIQLRGPPRLLLGRLHLDRSSEQPPRVCMDGPASPFVRFSVISWCSAQPSQYMVVTQLPANHFG